MSSPADPTRLDLDSPVDLLLTNGQVVDGTGSPAISADVGISADRIAFVDAQGATRGRARAHQIIDLRGQVLAPGFIDAHTHDDRAVLSSPDMTPKISQGVTSVIAGNCGVSLAPLIDIDPPPPLNLLGGREWFRYATSAEYMDAVQAAPATVNIANLVGHSTLRAQHMDNLERPATQAEIEQMCARVDEAMDAGCIGLSTGLAYPPAINAPTSEVIALAERAGRRGGIYATHMRNEKAEVVASVRETLDIGMQAKLPVVISHHKATGRPNFGLTKQTLALIEQARKKQTVDLDVYPYTASSTVLIADWAKSAEKVLVTWSKSEPSVRGRDLAEICTEWGVDLDTACARLHPAGAIYFQMDEADLRRVLQFDDSMIGSDGLPHDEFPHPRLWGSFPRVLGHYARDEGLFPLEVAVRKMTSIAARVFGLRDRGKIEAGAFADLVVFDPTQIIDAASFSDPQRRAAGIDRVLVNGQIVYENGKITSSRPGRLLRRS